MAYKRYSVTLLLFTVHPEQYLSLSLSLSLSLRGCMKMKATLNEAPSREQSSYNPIREVDLQFHAYILAATDKS